MSSEFQEQLIESENDFKNPINTIPGKIKNIQADIDKLELKCDSLEDRVRKNIEKYDHH